MCYTTNVIHLVNKKEGETPLAALERLCRDHGIYEKVTYAGRLDPMASGLLLVLSGDDVHKKDSMLEHTKTYEFTILLGAATDTGDILGKVTETVKAGSEFLWSGRTIFAEGEKGREEIRGPKNSLSAGTKKDHSDLLSASATEQQKKYKKTIESFAKTYNQPYPLYSSKTVDGKPLWTYAREGTKPDVVPTHNVTISRCVLNSVESITGTELLQQIHARIEPVVGDFRQDEILKLWRSFLHAEISSSPYSRGRSGGGTSINSGTFVLLNCTADVSSGTYIRQLAVDIGVKLGVPALAYNIHRTKVGNYSLKDALPEL